MKFTSQLIITSILIISLAATLFLFNNNTSQEPPNPNPNPIVTITFDDGRISQYTYAYPLMKERNINGTFYVITDYIRDNYGSSEFMSYAEILELQDAGNEIGSHSASHPSFTGLSEEQIRYQCQISKDALESYGLEINNFAYPYGNNNEYTDSIVDDYYFSARDAYCSQYVMNLSTNQFCLTAFTGETENTNALPYLKSAIDKLESGDWLVILFHSVEPNVNDKNCAISTQDFEAFLDYVVSKNVTTKTVNQVLNK